MAEAYVPTTDTVLKGWCRDFIRDSDDIDAVKKPVAYDLAKEFLIKGNSVFEGDLNSRKFLEDNILMLEACKVHFGTTFKESVVYAITHFSIKVELDDPDIMFFAFIRHLYYGCIKCGKPIIVGMTSKPIPL